MERKDRIDAVGAAMLVAFSALLGLNQVLMKLVNAGMEPFFQAGLRSLFALPIVLGFALFARKRLSISDGSLLPGLAAGACFGIEFALLFNGLDLTSVGRASVLFYTMPVWMAVGAHLFLGEHLTGRRIAGLGLAVAGVALALLWNSAPAGPHALIGDLMCLGAAGFWAALALIARATALSKSTPHMQLVYQLVVSAPMLLLFSLAPGTFAFAMTPGLWALLAVQIVAVASIGFLFWFWILSIYPASDMASFGFLAPVFGVFFGWLILGEAIGWNVWGALVLVGAALFLINRR